MSQPTKLPVNEKEFQHVWPIMQELGAAERHFNTIQGAYRTMASTWLLAALGGVGFIYSTTTFTADFSRDLIAGSIAAVAALGVALLWMLDVIVYHELLIAGYYEAQRLETTYEWLPRIRGWRRAGDSREKEWPVRKKVSLFYLGTMALLFLVAGATLSQAKEFANEVAVFAVVVIAGFIFIGTLFKLLDKRIKQERDARVA